MARDDARQLNLLFICSRNQWRSPTAERLWFKRPGIKVRSAGTAKSARRRVSLSDIQWADAIFVMEEKHKSRLQAEFRQDLRFVDIHVLDIPDDYRFMDPELMTLIEEATEPLVASLLDTRDGQR